MKTKFITVLLSFIVFFTSVYADVYVEGYYRSDGTYVKPHYRSSPNSTKLDNWSQKPNINPYTGKKGTKDCSLSYSCSNNSYNSKSYWD